MTARAMIAGGFHLVKPSIGESMFDEAEPKALQSRIKVMAKQLISLGRKNSLFYYSSNNCYHRNGIIASHQERSTKR